MGARAKELPHQSDLQDELSWNKSAAVTFFLAAVTLCSTRSNELEIWSRGAEGCRVYMVKRKRANHGWAVGPLGR
jgi:hypothetical protein